uniref:Secreted protein n=1 Tax=Anguilla anguilla TaxID=7936 RepID=A0A0E9XEY4_ANGAN
MGSNFVRLFFIFLRLNSVWNLCLFGVNMHFSCGGGGVGKTLTVHAGFSAPYMVTVGNGHWCRAGILEPIHPWGNARISVVST